MCRQIIARYKTNKKLQYLNCVGSFFKYLIIIVQPAIMTNAFSMRENILPGH